MLACETLFNQLLGCQAYDKFYPQDSSLLLNISHSISYFDIINSAMHMIHLYQKSGGGGGGRGRVSPPVLPIVYTLVSYGKPI